MLATATPVTYGHDASIARFSVARYQRMVETGILTTEDPGDDLPFALDGNAAGTLAVADLLG